MTHNPGFHSMNEDYNQVIVAVCYFACYRKLTYFSLYFLLTYGSPWQHIILLWLHVNIIAAFVRAFLGTAIKPHGIGYLPVEMLTCSNHH